LSNPIKDDEVAGARGTKGEKKNAYMVLMGKPEGKRPLVRP
jgi:hypothetical protein